MWDWRYPINDLRDEVRKARSDGNVSVSLDSVEKLIDTLSGMYERLERDHPADENGEKAFQNLLQKQKEVIQSSYEHAKQYSNIVVLGGYAGLFAIWNFSKEALESWQVLAVGLCALISLVIYIVFELYGAWLRTTQVANQMNELIQAEQLQKFPEEYGKGELERSTRFMAKWPYFFFSSVGFALLAASLLIYSFIAGLVSNYA